MQTPYLTLVAVRRAGHVDGRRPFHMPNGSLMGGSVFTERLQHEEYPEHTHMHTCDIWHMACMNSSQNVCATSKGTKVDGIH
jgi:hypothetical protein